MAATNAQRIGIWVIAIVMTVGTIGSFFAVILANNNAKTDQQTQQEQYQKIMLRVCLRIYHITTFFLEAHHGQI